MKDIRILGAGLAGLTAAINLSRVGYKVEVFEKNKDVGQRFHGDLQGLENWSEERDILEELQRMNIDTNFDCDPFSRLTLTNGSITREIIAQRPLFYLVKRGSLPGSLDQGLKIQALESGVIIHFGKTIPAENANIIATGPVLKEVPAIAKGIAFKTNIRDTAIALFNNQAAYKAYSYLLVTKGYGCMCSVVFGDKRRIKNCFQETRKMYSEMLNLDIKEPKNIGGIGSFSLKSMFENDKSFIVGEAAGLQDFLWGFGIRYAMTSGYLAAKSIVDDGDYKKVAEKHFSHRLKASAVNRYLWEKLGESEYSFLLKNAEFVKSILRSIHNYNIFQRILYPIALSYLREKYPQLRL